MNNKRNLSPEEIRQLELQDCTAEDWSQVYVSDNFDCQYVKRTSFSGKNVLGSFQKVFDLPGGLKKHSGICNATLHNCEVGDDTFIENVQNYMANYRIGAGCYIQQVDRILVDEVSSFGNNVQVSVLNETGGREVPIYDKLSASLAYIIALYRHQPVLISRLQGMIRDYAEQISSDCGEIGSGVRILNTGTIRNVKIGESAVIENATRLENGSVNSNEKAPAHIGDSVIAQDFIISSGAVVTDAAKIIRCFVGQACQVTHNFSAHDSLLFSNCIFENGEACAIFAGPFTVSMHKSSLLIAGMFSFLNAGSGSNQSNHMYKLGPIHQGIVERGSKTTSDSYILWPARVGAFSLVMGRHHHHSDTSDLPFSYLIENNDETWLSPGVNLRSVGTIRDAQKWPKRDKRTDSYILDKINYDLLSPYTVQKMLKAVTVLMDLQALVGETSEIYYYQNTRIKGDSLQRGLSLYHTAIRKYLGNILMRRLDGINLYSIEDLHNRLAKEENMGSGEWLDLSGLIISRNALDLLLKGIENGSFSALKDIEKFLYNEYKEYPAREWTWGYDHIESYFGVSLATITPEELIGVIRKWKESVIALDRMIYDDAHKEFSLTSMIGFGVDGSATEKQKDFEWVRGDFENNPFVKEVKQHMQTKENAADTMIARLRVLSVEA